jgi:hypothetical protein
MDRVSSQCQCSPEKVLLRASHDLLEWFAEDGFNDEVDEQRTRDLQAEIAPLMCRCAAQEPPGDASGDAAYGAFVRARMVDDRLAFHPDTRFSEYVETESGHGVYGKERAAELQVEHDRLYAACESDPYAVAVAVFMEVSRGRS